MHTIRGHALLIAALAAPAAAAPVNSLVSQPAPNAALEYAHRSALSAIDTAALTAISADSASFELTLPHLTAAFSAYKVERHASGAVSIFATFDDAPDSSAVITTFDGFVSARLEHPSLGAYSIEPTPLRDEGGAPLHRINEIDPTGFLPCATDDAPAFDHADNPADASARGAFTVDMMMLFTPNVRNTLGGASAAITFCQNCIDLANAAYDLSGVTNVQLRMVHVQEVDYTESGNTGTDLLRLRNANDNFFDEIHSIRNDVGADNVAMIINNASNACGQAASINPVNANLAFSVSVRNCAINNITFPHEIGHTMGCAHDRQSTGSSFYSYAFGHLFQDGNGTNRRTIMGVSSGIRIQRFSNPDVLFNGVPTGVASGSSAADNARAHDNSADDMSSHRSETGCLPFAILSGPADSEACLGAGLNLSVQLFAEDPGAISYQWRKNVVPIPGATNATLVISDVESSDSGLYDVIVSSDCVSITSAPALVTTVAAEFDTNPMSQTAAPGDDVTFTAAFPDPSVQIFWEKDGELILSAIDTDTLTLLNVDEFDAAVYTANALAPCGVIVSEPATLTVSNGAGCNEADIAEPFGVLDFSDVVAFLSAFGAADPTADLAAPNGVFDFSDVVAFLASFGAGCP